MRLGIMQPYFLPYIGYWQLLNVVDKYVIYDDVNFIKGGWINRNKILVNGQPKYFNIPMIGASSNKLINQVKVNNDIRLVNKNLRIIQGAYRKAPYYEQAYRLVESILKNPQKDIASFITESIKMIKKYLDIKTELIISSSLDKDNNLKGQDKVIAICKLLGATEYYNAIGGKSLYSYQEFKKNGIQLKFLNTCSIYYNQFENEFQPNLSVLDVMMFNSPDEIKDMLSMYTLVED